MIKLIRATEIDSEKLKKFFQQMVLPGLIDLSIERRGSFFDHYRLQSDDFETLLLVENEDQIVGMATLLFRNGLINGELQTWGIATDLRVAPTRRAVLQWAQHFLPELERACKWRECNYIFSAMQLHGNRAYNALLRPQAERRQMPRYYQVSKFHLIGLHGRLPFAPAPLSSIHIKPAELRDLEALCSFLGTPSRLRPVSLRYEPEYFIRRIERWPGLELNDFRIARDSQNNIIGCAALWDGRVVQAYIPQTYHGIAHTAHQTLSFASWLGIARPTAQPLHTMPMQYLTNLYCSNADTFHALAHEAFLRLGKDEFLTYGHFRGNYTTMPPRGWLATSIPYGLYLVLPPKENAPDWILPGPQSLPPEFEVAWL
jgi:hypothetical protein